MREELGDNGVNKARTLKAKAKHYQGQSHSPKAKAIPMQSLYEVMKSGWEWSWYCTVMNGHGWPRQVSKERGSRNIIHSSRYKFMVNTVVCQDFGLEFFGQGQTSKAKASLLQGQGHKIWP